MDAQVPEGLPAQVLLQMVITLSGILTKACSEKNDQSSLSTKKSVETILRTVCNTPFNRLDTYTNPNSDTGAKTDSDSDTDSDIDIDSASRALYAWLQEFEKLVSNNIRDVYEELDAQQEESEYNTHLHASFPKLMIMKAVIDDLGGIASRLTEPYKLPDIVLCELSRFVNLNLNQDGIAETTCNLQNVLEGDSRDRDKSRPGSAKTLAQLEDKRRLNKGHDVLPKSKPPRSQSPLHKVEDPPPLKQDERNFINKAYHVNSLYEKLFSHLTGTSSNEIHAAKLHLSGFLAKDPTFQLLLVNFGDNHWRSATYEWSKNIEVDQHGEEFVETSPGSHTSIFSEKEPDDIRPLRRLISNTKDLSPRDNYILQVLIACSLLVLDKSRWIQSDLSIDSVAMHKARETTDLLCSWKAHIFTSLLCADDKDRVQEHESAVLSFGLLIMQMGARQAAEPVLEEKDADPMDIKARLEQILREWSGYVEDDYRKIATACLMFRKLSDQYHDSEGTVETRHTAVIYQYIVAPLFRVAFNSDTEAVLPSPLKIKRAEKFMRALSLFAEKIRSVADEESSSCALDAWAPWRHEAVRIAILDTGIDKEDTLLKTAIDKKRIREHCGFVNDRHSAPDPEDFEDRNSHGTHVTRLALKAAPNADVLIAKISNECTIGGQNLHRIARAIRWAIEKEANIISISLGIDGWDMEIDNAIHTAVNANIAIFAAASNDGGNKSRTYPASRSHGVICIHASDGLGNDGGISPSPSTTGENFTTLGIAIKSRWKKKDVHISGTSYATPIAAGLAADVFELARHKCNLSQHQQQVLYHFGGVRRVMKLMVEQGAKDRGGYDYIMPDHLWPTHRSLDSLVQMIIKITNS